MVHYLSYFGQHSQFSFEPSLLCCLCQLLWLSWRLRPLTRGFSGKVRNCLYLAWFVRAVSQCTCPQCWCILICSIYFLSYASFSRFFAFFLNRSGSFCCEITSTSLSLAWSALHLGHLDVQQHQYTFKHFTIFFFCKCTNLLQQKKSAFSIWTLPELFQQLGSNPHSATGACAKKTPKTEEREAHRTTS